MEHLFTNDVTALPSGGSAYFVGPVTPLSLPLEAGDTDVLLSLEGNAHDSYICDIAGALIDDVRVE